MAVKSAFVDIQRALHAKAYYLALLGTLSLPGVCVFVIPGSGSSIGPTMKANRVIYLDLHTFCDDMADAVRGWLKAVKCAEPFETHMTEIVRVHPKGIPGAIELVPMVA